MTAPAVLAACQVPKAPLDQKDPKDLLEQRAPKDLPGRQGLREPEKPARKDRRVPLGLQ